MEGVVTIRLDDSKTIMIIGAIALVIALGSVSTGGQSSGGGGGGGNLHAGGVPRPSRTPEEWAAHYARRRQAWGYKILRDDRFGAQSHGDGGWL